ncbi:MAG: winged helix-turn-helix domain-containing protein, partial [Kibdelosporangium sp.]
MGTQVTLLGDVVVRAGDRTVELGHARQQCVLVVLLLEAGQVVPVEDLAERVWAEQSPRRVRNTLYGYLHRLRQALAGSGISIEHRTGGYQATLADVSVDVHRFTDLTTQARLVGDDGT